MHWVYALSLVHRVLMLKVCRKCLVVTVLSLDKTSWMLQERDQLKARARDEAAADEARRNKVTVTVDLLGRQVTSAERHTPYALSGRPTLLLGAFPAGCACASYQQLAKLV